MDSIQLLAGLSHAGVEVQDALDRFMGNQTLYLSFLCRLPRAMELPAIRQALADGREAEFYAKIHNLKGMAANLSVRSIAHPAQLLLEEYRAHGLDHPQVLEAGLNEIETAAAPLAALLEQYEASPAEGGHP